METLFRLSDLFLPLSEEKQQEVLDFVEFLYAKQSLSKSNQPLTVPENDVNIIPSEKLKNLLRERLAQHRANPQAGKNWNELKVELLDKYRK
ncbi:MAG TPA: DUF2281 domain-containing protein [Leptospiraceae bacterium]|nr:DUF2281 domain-containing protein [Leptospiraceae bacterium]HMX33918.1 DUF2281 domain-containing protein [Leptospiraceae bacterium]HMY31410.1 DUF2281 domain-containing protein [Leptospiraceae bacterium]HMZ67257.1 DUF2281 domain-containing protein [Leptospiraceae bacterium]HNA07475.1 DUF2281 domain-containing protein [Leptospiraceae bacterium]